MKSIVDLFGSVEVADYHETVTSQNFYLLTQQHAQNNFFPGSTQKKDFLRSLSLAIEKKLEGKREIDLSHLLLLGKRAIEEKHILSAFSDSSIQEVFSINGFSSSLSQSSAGGGISDFLGINEGNLGINKANYFLKRKIKQEVAIDAKGLLEKLTLSYFNGSEDPLGGDYKAYLRLILPLNAHIDSIEINGIRQNIVPAITEFSVYEQKGFTPPSGLEVEEYQEGGKNVFGFLTVVPKQQVQTITVFYALEGLDLSLSTLFYQLHLFKQPGTEEYPFEFSLSYNPSLSVFQKPAEFVSQDNTVQFSESFQKDQTFRIGFAKKL